ncbi:hypothetical protein [Uliginosibacterium gangwonense]|uniref:hypothetical protein n=1 Tax=Uliginosibacterium gangwonense TaxID=392736 RepID=UPI00036AFEEC|nr:hypothetical protein [Uliginosibacterium gangwonense]
MQHNRILVFSAVLAFMLTACASHPPATGPAPTPVKAADGSFDGEVYGTPQQGSRLSPIRIGMSEAEVQKLAGLPDITRRYATGKAFIPFYFGSDSRRREWVYTGSGSVAFNAGRGAGSSVVVMIHHDPQIK